MPKSKNNNNNTETDDEMYPGRATLVGYLVNSNPKEWSYISFLKRNSEFLIDLPPFLDIWNALDGTWTRRFLREVKELNQALYKDIKKKVESEHADVTICRFWEEVISKRNRLKLRNVLDTEGIELLKASSKFQSQKAQEDYEDLMKSSRDKRSLDNTTNNEVMIKKIKPIQGSSKKNKMLPDLSGEVDNFFNSPVEKKSPNPFSSKLRESKDETDDEECEDATDADITNATTEKVPVPQITCLHQNDIVHEDDESSYESSDESNESPIEADLQNFEEAYLAMDSGRMWTLSSGRKVEQVIYEFARNLHEESYLHSFMINDADVIAKKLFSQEEWEEITNSEVKLKTKLEQPQLELLKKYSLDNTKDLRKVLDEPFVPEYDQRVHFDLNFINFAYRAMLFLWEKEENLFVDSQLEGWYEMNVWSNLIDPLFHNLEIQLLRGEGMSLASSDRKNHERSIEERKKTRKKIGKKGDGVFRLLKKRLEFGAIEAGRKWEGKCGDKYLTDSLKLCKMLRDMIIQLSVQVDMIEDLVRQLQVVGILNGANRIQIIRMDLPKGYVCRIQREKVYDVAGRLTKSQPLALVLKELLRAKYTIVQTLNVIGKKEEADLENLLYDSEPCSPPRTITIPKTFDTPKTKRTKDLIGKKN